MNLHDRKFRRHTHTQQHQQHTQQQHHINNNNSEDQESHIDYLSRNNSTTLIKDAVKVLLANRPADPLQFLADYFSPNRTNTAPQSSETTLSTRQCTAIQEAYDKLNWADYSMPVYQRNVLEVYDRLCVMRNEGSQLHGLIGVRFNELLARLSANLPVRFSEIVYERVKVRPNQVISFNRFYHSVLLFSVLPDFVLLTRSMHTDLDVPGVGAVSKELCVLVAERLSSSGVLNGEDKADDILEERVFARCFLSNADSIKSGSSATLNKKDAIDEDEFVKMCLENFLGHVL